MTFLDNDKDATLPSVIMENLPVNEAATAEQQAPPREIPSFPSPLKQPQDYARMTFHIYATSLPVLCGNLLEWLDFGIYGYSEWEIAQNLFRANTSAGWAAFGLGYLVRPLGAWTLGRIADQPARVQTVGPEESSHCKRQNNINNNRRRAFQYAIYGMALSTTGLALLPAICSDKLDTTYCWNRPTWVSGLAILLRCGQGFSAGAAAGGVNVLQSEAHPSAQSVGINNVSGCSASILSAGIVVLLRQVILGADQYLVWGWRLALLLVLPPSIWATRLMDRQPAPTKPIRNVNDDIPSPSNANRKYEYELVDSEKICCTNATETSKVNAPPPPPLPVAEIASFDQSTNGVSWKVLMATSVYIQFSIAAYNNLNVYLVQFYKTNMESGDNTSLLIAMFSKVSQMLLTPLVAAMADIMGVFTVCAMSGAACAVVALFLLNVDYSSSHVATVTLWIVVSMLLPLVSTGWIANAPLLATGVFPRSFRSRGTSMVMALGTAGAGFFPFLLNALEKRGGIGDSSSSTCASCGFLLTLVAALGATAILWIQRQARIGRLAIYQRSGNV